MPKRDSRIIREGQVKIRYWPTWSRARGRVYSKWQFRYVDENSRAHRVTRAKLEDLLFVGRDIARRLAQRAATDWSGREAADYGAAKAALFGTGFSVEFAASVFANNLARLKTIGKTSIDDVVTDFIERHKGGVSEKPIADVVKELIEFRVQDGAGAEHLEDLRSRLGRFAGDFTCQIGKLTPATLENWLRGLRRLEKNGKAGRPVNNRTRRNYRAALSNLVGFARSRGYLPRDTEVMKAVAMPKLAEPSRGILTPEQMQWLLQSCTESLLPVLVLGAFAGLRQSETLLVHWKDINWEAGHIRVPEAGKTGGRLAPLLENLRAWLEPLKGEGRIVRIGKHGVSKAIDRTVAKTNAALKRQLITWRITWPRNGPRHSFVSYRCAITRNPSQVADESGHSLSELRRSYRNQDATPAQARAWFDLRPVKAENVLELPLLEAMTSRKSSQQFVHNSP